MGRHPQARGCCLLLLSLWCFTVQAQDGQWKTITDTSYFKTGEDEWNLVESVLRSDPANVFLLLNRGTSPNASAEGGMSALMFAAESGDSLSLQLLILNGADLEYTQVENTTPLLVAVLNQQFSCAHLLLQSGANPNHKDDYGGSALLYAAALNDYALADLLLFYGADPTVRDKQGNDAMMTAVSLKHLECTDILLQNGLNPDSRDKEQNTPLMIAAQQGNMQMASLLLEYEARLEASNASNYTPLSHAIQTSRLGMVEMLVDSGSNVHHLITPRMNQFDLARIQGKQAVIAVLKKEGAKATPRPDFSEFQLHWSNSFGAGEHLMGLHLAWHDRKFGMYVESGYQVRPVLKTRQYQENDTLIYQYRESRSLWSLGVGKNFTLARDVNDMALGAYASLQGMLSWAQHKGLAQRPPLDLRLGLSAGLFLQGNIAGIRMGADRYHFGSLHEGKWKMNVSLYLRMPYGKSRYHVKEITY